jgi:preprotein translocase subunit SecA
MVHFFDSVLQSSPASQAANVQRLALLWRNIANTDLRARADALRERARKGDPGASYFFVSLEDPLYRRFGEEKILPMLMERTAGQPVGDPVTDPVGYRALEKIRANIEMTAGAIRKEVLRFDSVLHERRETIWSWRRTLLRTVEMQEWDDSVKEIVDDLVDRIAEEAFREAKEEEEPVYKEEVWRRVRDRILGNPGSQVSDARLREGREGVVSTIMSLYRVRQRTLDDLRWGAWERTVLLKNIDTLWPEYLNELEAVEQDVHLRAYAQVDPFVAFRTEAAHMFGKLMIDIELTAVRTWLSVQHAGDRQTPRSRDRFPRARGRTPGAKKKRRRQAKRIDPGTVPSST